MFTMSGYATRDALRSLRRNPGLAAATCVTVTLAVALAGAGVLVRNAVDTTAARWADGVEFIVYVDPGATADDVDRIRDTLESSDSVSAVHHVTQDEAFEEFTELYASEQSVVEAVTPDLLPSSFRVSPTSTDPRVISSAVDPLRGDPAVYEIVTADDAVRDVRDLFNTASSTSALLTIVLSGVAIVLCAVMIRTSIAARRDEIAAMRLVGASRSYVAAPLVLEGALCGIGASLAAAVALLAGVSWSRGRDSRVVATLIPADPAATTSAVLVTAVLAAAAVATVALVVSAIALARTR